MSKSPLVRIRLIHRVKKVTVNIESEYLDKVNKYMNIYCFLSASVSLCDKQVIYFHITPIGCFLIIYHRGFVLDTDYYLNTPTSLKGMS